MPYNIMISRTIESFENKRVHKMYKCLPVLGKKTLFIPYILHVQGALEKFMKYLITDKYQGVLSYFLKNQTFFTDQGGDGDGGRKNG